MACVRSSDQVSNMAEGNGAVRLSASSSRRRRRDKGSFNPAFPFEQMNTTEPEASQSVQF